MNSSQSAVMSSPREDGAPEVQRARPQRQVGVPSVPRVESLGEFGLMITRQLTQCRRYGARMSVMWLEAESVDAAPDHVPQAQQADLMIAVGRRLRSRVRGTDAVVQVGESSFAVLLIDAGAPESDLVRHRLLHALGGSYGVAEGQLMHVRLRIGASSFPDGSSRGADLAQLARDNLRARAG